MLKTLLPLVIADPATYPFRSWIPPPYTRLIFMAANVLPSSAAALRNATSFPRLEPPKTQMDVNFRVDGLSPLLATADMFLHSKLMRPLNYKAEVSDRHVKMLVAFKIDVRSPITLSLSLSLFFYKVTKERK